MGLVGRFSSYDATLYPRRSRVVVRSRRGLEVGEVLSSLDPQSAGEEGAILRGMTIEDELLQARLVKKRQAALDACATLLAERRLPATLLDVEQLFDGSNLLFYFLGDIPSEVESLTAELAEAYESQAQTRRFAETLTEGCGPGCGTEAATGGGCTTCSTCAVAGACGPKRK